MSQKAKIKNNDGENKLNNKEILIPENIEKINVFNIELRFFENKKTQSISSYGVKRIGGGFNYASLSDIDPDDLGIVESLYQWKDESEYGVKSNIKKFTQELEGDCKEITYAELLMNRLNIDYDQVQSESDVKQLVVMKQNDEYLVLVAYNTKIITYIGILHSDMATCAEDVIRNPYEFSIFEKNQIIGKVRENIDADIAYYLFNGYLLVSDDALASEGVPFAIKHIDIVFEHQSALYETLVSTDCSTMLVDRLTGQRIEHIKGDDITGNFTYPNDGEAASIVFIEGDLAVKNLIFKTVKDVEINVYVSGDVTLNYFIQESDQTHLHVLGNFIVKEAIFNSSHHNIFLKNRDIDYMICKEAAENDISLSEFCDELITFNPEGERELNGNLIADYVLSDKPIFKDNIDMKKIVSAARVAYEEAVKKIIASKAEEKNESAVSKDSYLYTANINTSDEPKSQSQAKLDFLKKHNLRTVSYAEALRLLKVDVLFEDFHQGTNDFDDVFVEDDDDHIFYAETDVHIQGDLDIPNTRYYPKLLIVDGNLTVTGEINLYYYVTGDANFDTLSMNDYQICLGKENVRYLQYQIAEEDGAVNSGRPREVSAPYFFSWYYNLDAYSFTPSTRIFALYDWNSLKEYKTDNPLFSWHEYVFAMKPEFYYPVEEFWHNTFELKIDKIHEALVAEKSLFMDGFNLTCIPYYNKAKLLAEEGDTEQAFLYYKKTIDIAPSFYPAYEDAGRCLFRVGAFKQAKLFFDQGTELMPAHNEDPDFYCTVYSGLVSVLAGDYQVALSSADLALERNAKTPFAQRLKGEALIHLDRLEDAEKALLLAYEENEGPATINWLLGLVYFLKGNHEKSKEYFETAKRRDENLLPYTDTTSLNHFYAPATEVDWLDKSIDTYEPQQSQPEYWLSYFDGCKDNPSSDDIERIPQEFRSLEMLEYLLSTQKEDGTDKTSNGRSIEYFWHLDINKKLIIKALNSEEPVLTHSIPNNLLDKEILLSSPKLRIDDIPVNLLNYDVCLHAASYWSGYNYEKIPNKFKDERMAVVAISSGALDIDSFPVKYTGYTQLKAAIDLGVETLSHFPAKYVDTTIFNYAQGKYGDTDLWQKLLEKNSPEFSGIDSRFFEKVWAHFWTEDLILKAVDEGAGIYDLDESQITQAISKLAVTRDSYTFEYIPEKHIDQELCLSACSRNYGSALEFVPISMRTQKVCKASVLCSSENLKFVPLKYRTLELCKKLFLDDSGVLKFIPYEHHVAIFDELLAHPNDDYYKSYLLVSRGIAYLYQNKLEKAVNDFIKARQDPDELTDENEQKSFYYQGLVYHRLDDSEKAQACYQKSQELDTDETGLTSPYSEAELPPIFSKVYKLDKRKLDPLLESAFKHLEEKQAKDALDLLEQAEQLLDKSGCSDMSIWAVIWDYQRYALYEVGDIQGSRKICKDYLPKLKEESLWPFLEEHNRIRHTLRGMHNTLAYEILETAKTIDELKPGLEHSRQALETVSPIEESSALYPYYQGRAELLKKASEFEPRYAVKLKKVLKKITTLGLTRKGVLSDEFIAEFDL